MYNTWFWNRLFKLGIYSNFEISLLHCMTNYFASNGFRTSMYLFWLPLLWRYNRKVRVLALCFNLLKGVNCFANWSHPINLKLEQTNHSAAMMWSQNRPITELLWCGTRPVQSQAKRASRGPWWEGQSQQKCPKFHQMCSRNIFVVESSG